MSKSPYFSVSSVSSFFSVSHSAFSLQNLVFVAMKKLVVELQLHDEKTKLKAMRTVSGMSGIQLIHIEPENKKLTVIGDIDPVRVVKKLRKHCYTAIVSVGPEKEEKEGP